MTTIAHSQGVGQPIVLGNPDPAAATGTWTVAGRGGWPDRCHRCAPRRVMAVGAKQDGRFMHGCCADHLPENAHRYELLILGCSARKRDLDRAPAIVLYDGVFFRILRKRRPEVALLILSGKYGLLQPGEIIEPYDQKLKQGDQALMKRVAEQWQDLGRGFNRITTCMSRPYESALPIMEFDRIDGGDFQSGGLGKKCQSFATWCQARVGDMEPGYMQIFNRFEKAV